MSPQSGAAALSRPPRGLNYIGHSNRGSSAELILLREAIAIQAITTRGGGAELTLLREALYASLIDCEPLAAAVRVCLSATSFQSSLQCGILPV